MFWHHYEAEAIEALRVSIEERRREAESRPKDGEATPRSGSRIRIGRPYRAGTSIYGWIPRGPDEDLYVDAQLSIQMHVLASHGRCQHLIIEARGAVQFQFSLSCRLRWTADAAHERTPIGGMVRGTKRKFVQ